MALTIYGIRNCNTVKSAVDWLTKNKVAFEFHDFKSKGIPAVKLKAWCSQVGWESLVNKRGTTWRQLPADIQNQITSERTAIDLMMEKPSVIKRPVVEAADKIVTLGFDPEQYQRLLISNF